MNSSSTTPQDSREWKVILNNRCHGRANIEYIMTKEGPEQAPTFKCEAQVNGTTWGEGNGKRKTDAEIMAAKAAVEFGDSNNKFETL